jgi:hypothetical protein
MEALTIAAFIIATLALAVAFITIPVVSYVVWKYVFIPWKVMRTDVERLSAKVRVIEASMTRNQVQGVSDEHAARVEARLNARARAQEMAER